MNQSDVNMNNLFTTNGRDVWRIEDYYDIPSVTMVNLETKEKANFGIQGLTADTFKKIFDYPASEFEKDRLADGTKNGTISRKDFENDEDRHSKEG